MAVKRRSLSEAKKMAAFFWIAFISALFIYVYFAFIFAGNRAADGTPDGSAGLLGYLKPVFSALALICFALAIYIRRNLPLYFIKESLKQLMDKAGRTDDQTREAVASGAVTTFAIITAAALEASALFGLILVLLGAEFMTIIPFTLLSLLGFIIMWPTRRFGDRVVEKINSIHSLE